jgi:2'-deoxynucleoside 5'-phosphate N-hydrolase
MKIYFAGSICGGRGDKELYFQLIEYLHTYGQVLTEHVGSKELTEKGEDTLPEEKIYSRDVSWIKEADVLVAEVSTPSLGVGYEIGRAEEMNKKILCLYRDQEDKKLSAMISGNPKIEVARYKEKEDALQQIDAFFAKQI